MKKILVCEDEAAIRDFVVINLTRAGYDVVEADCGETALKKYEEHEGDPITHDDLLDFHELLSGDGWIEALERLTTR